MAIRATKADSDFLHLVVKNAAGHFQNVKVGAAIPGISRKDVLELRFHLPPLAEQKRIVAKVEELMGLCDELEAAQAERERQRERLNASSLNRIATAPDDEALRTAARFHFQILPRVTVRPDQIAPLRQTILDLAVRGKLVAQADGEDSGHKVVDALSKETIELISSREIKKPKATLTLDDSDTAFTIPPTWKWVRLAEVIQTLQYGTSKKCGYEEVGVPVLRIPNVANGKVDITDLKFTELSAEEQSKLSLQAGDLLLVRSNGSLSLVGRTAVVDDVVEGYSYAGYLVRIRHNQDHLVSAYLQIVMTSRLVRDQIEGPIRSAVGLKNINSTEMSNLTIPVPPTAEQHRIVAKVDELMSFCDELEASLSRTETESRRLLDAVMAEISQSA